MTMQSSISLLLFIGTLLLYQEGVWGKPKLWIGDRTLSHQKVGILKVDLAARSMRLPDLIPLLFGNSILRYKKVMKGFEIQYEAERRTEVYPLRKKRLGKHVAGFVFKRSSLDTYPVPMENTVVILRLIPISRHFGYIHMWIMSQGVYSAAQKTRQKLFAKSLLQDFADNSQRSLGVRICPNRPTVSGLCNNLGNAFSGVTYQEFRQETKETRKTTSEILSLSPGPRLVSNTIFTSTEQVNAPRQTSLLMILFGQFIDHEITATPPEHLDKEHNVPIPHPDSDKKMDFTRSGILRYPYDKCCRKQYLPGRVWERPPFNTLTSFIDGGAIYGSENLRANTLRRLKKGELILKERGGELHLPLNNAKDLEFELENESDGRTTDLFVAGDVRANENPILLSIHTVFAREHNRICKMLRNWLKKRGGKPLLRDEWIYQHARLIVMAELQNIVFNEFVPAMLGDDALGQYSGYKPRVDARISTLFSAFAFRWGHSGVPETMEIKDRRGEMKTTTMKELFFSTKLYDEHGLDNMLLSAMNTAASNIDEKVTDSLRDFLFNPHDRGVLDLVSLNIQRSRDLGIPSYTALQKRFKTGTGLEKIKPELRQQLLDLYGSADNIEAYVGGLSETTKEGSLLGPLFHAINVDQFRRLRDGDRFYYENIHWHPLIKNMPLVQRIRKHQIRLLDVVFPNTKLKASDIGDRSSAFKTAKSN